MRYLFISRKNTHLRYYKRLCPQLELDTRIHQMGEPIFKSLLQLPRAKKLDLSEVIANQLKRKIAKQGLIWNLEVIRNIYCQLLFIWERFRVAKYLHVFDQENPTMLVIWNGKKLPNQTVVMVAKHLKIPVYFFENGLLPNTTTLDPKGVNYNSSIPRDPSFFMQFQAERSSSKKNNIVARKQIKKRSNFLPTKLPKRYAFIPFQVPHDTQIMSHSNWVDSMETLFNLVTRTQEYLIDQNLEFVFKEHPTWAKHYRSLYKRHPKAMFANGNDTVELIKNAEVIITINSTVGLEALQLNKKVITLGDACYNIAGLTQHANSFTQLVGALNNLNYWNCNSELKERFLGYLKEIYCIPASFNSITPEHIDSIRTRLLGKDKLMEQLLYGEAQRAKIIA